MCVKFIDFQHKLPTEQINHLNFRRGKETERCCLIIMRENQMDTICLYSKRTDVSQLTNSVKQDRNQPFIHF